MGTNLKLLIILMFFTWNSCKTSYVPEPDGATMIIDQHIKDNYIHLRYVIVNKFIIIEQKKIIDRSNGNEGYVIVFKSRLKNMEFNNLIGLIKSQNIFSLNDRYEIYLIDGFGEWNVFIDNYVEKKCIHIVNEKVPEIDLIFGEINKLVPKSLRISRLYY